MTRIRLILSQVAVAIVAVGTSPAAQFIPLGELPGGINRSIARDLSDDGSVILGDSDSDAFPQFYEVFVWTAEAGMFDVGFPSQFTFSHRISGDGNSIAIGNHLGGAFILTELDGLKELGAITPNALSFDGSVVVGEDVDGPARWTQDEGIMFLGTLGTQTDGYNGGTAYDVSQDGSTIVGVSTTSHSDTSLEAFRWTDETGMVGLGELPGGNQFSRATAISSDGSVITGDSFRENGAEAFRWTAEDGMVGLGSLSVTESSYARGINSDGSIIVGHVNTFDDESVPFRAFTWSEQDGMRDLRDILITEHGLGDSLDGWLLETVQDITPDGQFLVGQAVNPAGDWEAFLVQFDSNEPFQAGDADRDYDFDQLDLVQVQIAAKYLSGRDATWGEGDWNGAPSLVGDELFDQQDIIAALQANVYLTGPYAVNSSDGLADFGPISLVFDASTGQLHFGESGGEDLTYIPEPTSSFLLIAGLLMGLLRLGRSKRIRPSA